MKNHLNGNDKYFGEIIEKYSTFPEFEIAVAHVRYGFSFFDYGVQS